MHVGCRLDACSLVSMTLFGRTYIENLSILNFFDKAGESCLVGCYWCLATRLSWASKAGDKR